MKEIWKDIKNFEGSYQVSNLGRVKSLSRKRNRIYGVVRERILRAGINRDGYACVILFNKLGKKGFKVHRLVAKAFVLNNENKPQINHKDGNKCNNNISNLEWVTHSENALHAIENNLMKSVKEKVKVKQLDKNTGKSLNIFNSVKEAAKNINISPSNISSCLTEKRKTAGGFCWRRV